MNFEAGQIVYTKSNDGIHKKILSKSGARSWKLVWFSYEGLQFEFISEDKIKAVISSEPTKQFLEMEGLYKRGHSTFILNEERKKQNRAQLAKASKHRKIISYIN